MCIYIYIYIHTYILHLSLSLSLYIYIYIYTYNHLVGAQPRARGLREPCWPLAKSFSGDRLSFRMPRIAW